MVSLSQLKFKYISINFGFPLCARAVGSPGSYTVAFPRPFF